ncbi:hypothetical protein M011DRAFT_525712 [Sporormia fimetaria CBS 119925]|uniref:Uncharacterized protein n=1 Tax=Sporormia fimetaria CBS 119925 TaxID=1340428 RepID=A0A6A6VCX6_9PLEO|nr:hypothetical protein M011DRAFT_525712 [Sporormia fimetaria CBS 119925]
MSLPDHHDPQHAGPSTPARRSSTSSISSTASSDFIFIHNQDQASAPSEPQLGTLTARQSPNGRIGTLPSEEFKGTWEAAYQETAKTAKEISKASTTFAAAVCDSGIGRAGAYLGAALSRTANRGALTAAKYAVDKAGTDESKLPPRLRSWLKRGDRKEGTARNDVESSERRQETEVVLIASRPAESKNDARTYSMESPQQAKSLNTPQKNAQVFETLDTPTPVRRQLSKPLDISTQGHRPALTWKSRLSQQAEHSPTEESFELTPMYSPDDKQLYLQAASGRQVNASPETTAPAGTRTEAFNPWDAPFSPYDMAAAVDEQDDDLETPEGSPPGEEPLPFRSDA